MNSTWVNCQLQLSIYVISISFLGGHGRIRTADLSIMSAALYRLSYMTKMILYYYIGLENHAAISAVSTGRDQRSHLAL